MRNGCPTTVRVRRDIACQDWLVDIQAELNAIRSREDLATFILSLRQDLSDYPAEWENPTLDRFLEALAAWCADMPGYFLNRGEPQPDQPDWQLVGLMLLAASRYE